MPTSTSRHSLLQRNALVLAVAKRQVHVLQTLCSSALEQVVDGNVDDDALARAVDGEATDFDAVLTADVLDERALARNLDELLLVETVLVELSDVARGHLVGERDGDGVVDAGEPDSDVGDERHGCAELCGDLALVDMVSQTVGNEVVG